MDYAEVSKQVVNAVKSGNRDAIDKTITSFLFSKSVSAYNTKKSEMAKTLFNTPKK